MVKRDLFDILQPDDDIFDRLAKEPPPPDIFDSVQAKIAAMPQVPENVKELIKEEIEKLKPQERIIERVIEKKVIHPVPVHLEPKVIEKPAPPPQIVKEVRVEVQKPDTRKLVEQPAIDEMKKEIESLKKELKETKEMADRPLIIHGSTGNIPSPDPNPVGHVLTVNDHHKAEWKASAGLSGFTVNNPNELTVFDVNSFTPDELARVVGTIITRLQS